MLLLRVVVTTLLLATSATAALTEFVPPAPTTAAPVSVALSSEPGMACPPAFESVDRQGSTVRLQLSYKAILCPAVIGTWRASWELGTFAAGEYNLEVYIDSRRYVTSKFVVRQANPSFTVRPFAHVSRPAGPQVDSGVEAVIDGLPGLCRSEVCSNVKVFFGDVAVPATHRAGRLTVRVPAHAPGAVDVKVVNEDTNTTFVSPAAAYFYDRSAAPDPTIWARVLFPVLQSGGGAFGAQWVTETVIYNGNDYVVENFNRVDPLQCFDVGCERIAPRQYFRFDGRDHARGAVLLVPREAVDSFAFSTRVRDRAREAEDFGTEIPVIRESAMRRSSFRLIDVPATGAYRSKLRVYVHTPDDELAVFINGLSPDGEDLFFRRLTLERVDANLAYAELDLQTIPQLDSERVILNVVPPTHLPAWGFVTVTNNATQRVTVVTPN